MKIRELCFYWPGRKQTQCCGLLMGARSQGMVGSLCKLKKSATVTKIMGVSVLQPQGAEFCQPFEKLGRGPWTPNEECSVPDTWIAGFKCS